MSLRAIYDQYMYRLINTIFLCGFLMLFGNEWLEIGVPIWLLLGAVIFFTAITVLLEIVGRKRIVFAVGVLLIGGIIALLERLEVPVLYVFQEAFGWLFRSRDIEEINALRHAVLSVLPLLFATVLFVFQVIRFRRVRYGVGLASLLVVIVLATLEQMVSSWYVLFLFVILLSCFYEYIIKSKVALTHLLPLVFIMALLITALPARQESIHWLYFAETSIDFIRRTGRRISDRFPGREGGEFGVSMTGFTGDGRVRGEIIASDREALRVRIGNEPQDIYLIGAIMDTYTGAGWTRTQNMDGQEYPEHLLDLFELLLTLFYNGILSEYENEYIRQILALRNMEITHTNIRTRSVFYPLKAYSVTYSGRIDTDGASMFFPRRADEGTSYTIRYLAVNYEHEVIERILQNESIMEEITLDGFERNLSSGLGFRSVEIRAFPREVDVLIYRRERINYYYTALPDSIPERVHELAREITAPYTSTFEKMQAIESYFTRQGFSYTLTPPPLPEGDFVDWFLFEGESGYCTYFATAAAVLGRSVGIPVRYVQGFRRLTEGGTVSIRGYHAHAWVEAYIAGFGWVPFEPTPTFYTRQNLGFAVRGEAGQPVIPDWMSMMPEEERWNADEVGVSPEMEEEQGLGIYAYVLSVAMGILVIILILLLVGGYYLLHKSKRRYQNASRNARFLYDFTAILFLLELQGKQIQSGETLRGFGKRMDDTKIARVVKIHEKLIYQKEQIKKEDMAVILKSREDIYKDLQGRRNRLKYLVYLLSK